jgi:hypothetical protein
VKLPVARIQPTAVLLWEWKAMSSSVDGSGVLILVAGVTRSALEARTRARRESIFAGGVMLRESRNLARLANKFFVLGDLEKDEEK